MPTYQYRCEECGHTFETIESFDEHGRGQPNCPDCDSPRVEQVFSTFFAKTDRKS